MSAEQNEIKPSERPIPVTLLSGFLGSGKTSLMKHILQNREGLRVAVIMNEITEENIDVMALEGSKIMQSEEKIVEMSNGCICCTLREDLLLQLRDLSRSGNFDAVLIESSGIAEPMQVAETFFVDTNDGNVELQMEAPLDNCVTVIDASVMRQHMESLDGIEALDPNADTTEESATDIAGLLFSQLEFANVILLNKVDLLGGANKAEHQKRVEELVTLVKKINPHAQVIPSTHSQVPMDKILRTRNFSLEFAEKIDNWMEDIKSGVKHVPETLEYGISNFFFTSDKPFHPQRLHDWMDDYYLLKQVVAADASDLVGIEADAEEDEEFEEEEEEVEEEMEEMDDDDEKAADEEFEEANKRSQRYGNVFRSKGFIWIGGGERSKHLAQWSQAGNILTLQHCGVLDGSSVPGQKLAFIGQNLKHDLLREDMEALLLTDAELEQMKKDIADGKESFEDPLEPFPLAANHTHDHDHDHDEEEEEEEEEIPAKKASKKSAAEKAKNAKKAPAEEPKAAAKAKAAKDAESKKATPKKKA